MISRWLAIIGVVVSLMLVSGVVHARMVHDFDCTFCHLNYTSAEVPYMTYNVCLDCHFPGNEGTTYQLSDGSDSNPITATFTAGDGSDAMGSNAAADAETSHFFAGSSDNQPAAGATPPTNFRFNLGWANGQVTCSRCHNPHGDTNNPKLLKLGVDSTEAMCLDCHSSWDQTGNHGLGSHPLHDNYPALSAANPDKFRAAPDNFGTNGSIGLVDSTKASCSSCHGVHFVDSDASTSDGVGASLSTGDGKLLKFDGSSRENPDQSICQTCHVYDQHGLDSGLGCMACHGGHEYDAGGDPNYYMLKKQATLALVPKTGLAGTVNLVYTTYPVPANLGGICQECHNLPSGHDADSSCKNCHSHSIGFAHGAGSTGSGCVECHGHDAGTLVDADMQEPYTAGAIASQGIGTVQSHSTHTELTGADAKGPGIYCDTCHDINDFPYFKSGTDGDGDGRYNLTETDVCDTCHSAGGSYDGLDDITIGAKQHWAAGVYDGTESGTLLAGKEKWCVTCHDESPSIISSVSAPNVAGDEDGDYTYGTGWGYYKTGHGLAAGETFPSKGGVETLSGRALDCDICHDYATAHIDGDARTYDDGDALTDKSDVYREGYRLKLINGEEPMRMPLRPIYPGTPTTTDDFRVCFQIGCHDIGPYNDPTNMNTNLITDGINRHAFHVDDHAHDTMFASDWSGSGNSRMTCVVCHNVHGSTRLAMVRDGKLVGREPGQEIWYKNDSVSYLKAGSSVPPVPEDLPLSASDGTAWNPASSITLCAHCHPQNGQTATEDRLPFQDVNQAPLLEWAGGTGLTSDGVAPDSGVGQSTFTFRISYSDINNDNPSPIEVWVDLDDNGTYEVGEKFTMTAADALDTNIYDGKTYTKSLAIAKAGDGTLSYRFYAQDGTLEATGAPTADSTVTILNNAPTLAWTGEDFYQADGTNPDIGGNGDVFAFRINLTDGDNETPSVIQIWIDENDDNSYGVTEKHNLAEVDGGDTTTSDGKLYAASLSLARAGDGDLTYRFYAADASDDATGTPTQESLLTVQAGANSPPSLEFVAAGCTVDCVKPQSGATGAEFDFTVRYVDHENEAPSTIQVWIDENDNSIYEGTEQFNLTEVDGGDTTYSDGKLYTTSRVLTLSGDNIFSYRFYATDGTDSAGGEAVSDHSVTVVDALKVRPAGGSGWYSTIQSAIDAVNGAHTVLVYDGTYNEDVAFLGSDDNNTVLRSACGPDTTIINGSGSVTTVRFGRWSGNLIDGFQVTGGTTGITVEGTQVTINNCQVHDNNGPTGGGIAVFQSGDMPTLTLTNSEIYSNSSDRGGGVLISRGIAGAGHIISNTIIRNNTVTGDSMADGGGGVNLNGVPDITISNSVIKDNMTTNAYSGGGLYVGQVPDPDFGVGDGLVVSDSIISGNTSNSWGGGVLSDLSKVTFIRSSITGNTAASYGGAIAQTSAGFPMSFENCILVDNQASTGGMAHAKGTLDIINSTVANNQATSQGGAIYNQVATTTIRNSIFWGNLEAGLSNIAYSLGGTITISDSILQNGNDNDFTNEPVFRGYVTPDISGFMSGDDPWFVGDEDYHIQAFSPAVDNANATYAPALDIDGQSRPQGAADDIGADEYQP